MLAWTESPLLMAISSLWKIGTGNPQAISTLISLIDNCLDEATRCQAASNLAQINCGNPVAITALFELLSNSQRSYTMITKVMVQPSSWIESGIIISQVKNLNVFKFTEELQSRLNELSEKNKAGMLTSEEEAELTGILELDRILTLLNARLIAES